MSTEATLRRKLARAERKVEILEGMIEDRTRALYRSTRALEDVIRTLPGALLVFDEQGVVVRSNDAAVELFGSDPVGAGVSDLLEGQICDGTREERIARGANGDVHVLCSASRGEVGCVCVLHDLTDRRLLETQLRHAQKMEAVGQLAAGLAHEINTPIQFISDSAYLIQEGFQDLERVLEAQAEVIQRSRQLPTCAAPIARLEALVEEVDLPWIREEMPESIQRTLEGLQRVSDIVKAVQRFSHVDRAGAAPTDLNEALRSSATVSRNVWKYVAELKLELQPLPLVVCHAGDLNQVFLNLLVNAAHAIEDARGPGQLGTIRATSRRDDGWITIEVHDDGCGIDDDVAARIFEPFFTTKDVGRGTGQGLSIAYHVVAQHGGTLSFDSTPGQGTVFTVRLPTQGVGGGP